MVNYSENEVYFRLVYPDAGLLYPIIQSFIFIGINLSDEDNIKTWYFKFIGDYVEYGSILKNVHSKHKVCCETESTVSCMLDVKGLNLELELAAARRLTR
jgi:hypothetical protein